jgi:hypothetical protein
MKNKNTTALTLDQNIAASVALIANIRENLTYRHHTPAVRENIRFAVQALRVLRATRLF